MTAGAWHRSLPTVRAPFRVRKDRDSRVLVSRVEHAADERLGAEDREVVRRCERAAHRARVRQPHDQVPVCVGGHILDARESAAKPLVVTGIPFSSIRCGAGKAPRRGLEHVVGQVTQLLHEYPSRSGVP
jgi:hypothetical protein